MLGFEGDIFVKKELHKGDDNNGEQFANQRVKTCERDHAIEQSLAECQTCESYRIKGKKALCRLVLDAEVERAVEEETAEDAAVDAEDICPQVGHEVEMTKKGVDTKVKGGAEAADESVEDKVTELKIQRYHGLHISFSMLQQSVTT